MLESFHMSDAGRVRSSNQDFCDIVPEIGLYLLADGMGGAKGGERASRIAVETVAASIKNANVKDAGALINAVEEANRRVLEEANRDPKLEGMGTTLVAALEMGEDLAIASVGDSRAYVLNETGLTPITEDQTWVQEVGKPLGLDEESLRNHPMRHVLTMAIGVGVTVTIRYYLVRLQPPQIMLLSSDGLHGVVDPPRIEKILRDDTAGNSTLEEKCKHLIEAARDAGGPDNISAVLIRAA